MKKLKPCPFCGGNAEISVSSYCDGMIVEAYVFCEVCDTNTGIHWEEDYAIKLWNTRVSDIELEGE